MHCPDCNTTLTESLEHNITIYSCSKCNSVSIKNEQLGEYLKIKASENNVPHAAIDLDKKPINTYKYTEPHKSCPQCTRPMKLFNYRYDSNIFLNKCDACHLVWIQSEELNPLISIVKGNPHITELGKTIANIEKEKEERRLQNQISAPVTLYGGSTPILLGDENEIHSIPWATISIISICTLTLLYQLLFVTDQAYFFKVYGFVPAIFSPIALLTSIFIHGDVMHLVGNMIYLWVFGDNVEEKIGKIHYVVLFILFGVVASLFSALFETQNSIPHIGASGAISGILGTYLMLYPKARVTVFWFGNIRKLNAAFYLVLWFIGQLIYSMMYADRGIDYTAHIFGFLIGMFAGYQIKKMKHLTNQTDYRQADSL